MKFKIWRAFFHILTDREDFINNIKPFIENLNNCINIEKYCINDEDSFLKAFSSFDLGLLCNNGIIDKEKVAIVPKTNL